MLTSTGGFECRATTTPKLCAYIAHFPIGICFVGSAFSFCFVLLGFLVSERVLAGGKREN